MGAAIDPDRIRLGVLGAGNIADLNVAGYLRHPRCTVAAVCDVDEAAGGEAAERWGVPRVYTDLDAFLSDDGIDAVEVLTPTHLHHAHVLAALEAGKHVSVQKPVTNSVAEALELAAAAEERGLTLRVSECFVHYPPLELAKQLVLDGAIGRPTGHPDPHRGRPDGLGLPGQPPARGIRVASRLPQPRRPSLRRHGAQVRHGLRGWSIRTSSPSRRSSGAGICSSSPAR